MRFGRDRREPAPRFFGNLQAAGTLESNQLGKNDARIGALATSDQLKPAVVTSATSVVPDWMLVETFRLTAFLSRSAEPFLR